MRLHSVLLCGRISFALPRANLARSPAPVPLTAASISATRQHPTPKRRYTMKEINLREFYPWYMEDVMVEYKCQY